MSERENIDESFEFVSLSEAETPGSDEKAYVIVEGTYITFVCFIVRINKSNPPLSRPVISNAVVHRLTLYMSLLGSKSYIFRDSLM